MRAYALCGFTVMALVATLTTRAFPQDGSKIYLAGLRSCVLLHNIDASIQGSGSVVNVDEGYILTNWHVVQKAGKLLVVFPIWEDDSPVVEAERYNTQLRKIGLVAKVVAAEEKVDLAVIKIVDPTKIPRGTEAVKFAGKSPLPGAKIYSIGNPGASDAMWIYTPGEVRSVHKKTWKSGNRPDEWHSHDARIIEATSPTNPGDSGGPCFNDKCEQVGVTQGGLNSKLAQGFTYFIDAAEVKNLLRANKIPFSPRDGLSTEQKNVASEKAEPKSESTSTSPPDQSAKLEKTARSNLNLIQPLIKDTSRRDFAAKQLKKLIEQYPKTEAAKEAQELLNKLK